MSHRQESDCIRNGAVFSAEALGKPRSSLSPSIPSLSRAMEKGASPSASSSVALASSSTATFKEELLCPICYEPFREAVTLCCGHNFCKGCVSRSWEHRHHVCPVCKEPSSFDDLRVNHTLNNLVEMILKEDGQRRGRAAALCPLHHEEAKLFCLEDKELACFTCQSSEQHEGHKMRPVQEAAADFRVRDAPGTGGAAAWRGTPGSGGVQLAHALAQTCQCTALACAQRGCTCRRARMKTSRATRVGPLGVSLLHRCPTLSLLNNYPVPPRPLGHSPLPCGKGERDDALRGLTRSPRLLGSFFLRLDPATLVIATAGYCSSTSGLGACLGWGLHNSPNRRDMGWGGSAEPHGAR